MERVCDQCIFDEKLWKALPDPKKNTTCDRCKRRHCVTKLTSATRERDIRPPRPAKSIDWEGIKQQFFDQGDIPGVKPYLRSLGWTENQILAGNTSDNTLGWGDERAAFRRQNVEDTREANKQAMLDYAPQMYEAKLKLVKRLVKKAETEDEVRDLIAILESIKTELGEPTRVSKSQIALDDSIDEALKELRSVVNTGRKGEDGGGSASVAAATATTPDPS